MSAMGTNLLQLLRTLTPFEVGRLTSALDEKNKRQDAQNQFNAENTQVESALETKEPELVLEEQNGQAKILPFNEMAATETASNKIANIEKHDKFLAKLGLKKKVRKPAKKVVGGEDFEDENEDDENSVPQEEQVSTTIFLLQEKEKIRKSQLKLVGQDALKTYRTQAAIDTSHEDKEDLSQSSSSGILVNKRQF